MQIITLLFPFTEQKYIYPPVSWRQTHAGVLALALDFGNDTQLTECWTRKSNVLIDRQLIFNTQWTEATCTISNIARIGCDLMYIEMIIQSSVTADLNNDF